MMKNPIRRIFDFDRREVPIAFLLFFFFFAVILVFQITKPLKKALFIETYGADVELYVKLTNIVVAALAAAVFSILYNKLTRRRLIYLLCSFFVVSLLVLTLTLQDPGPLSIWGFYLLGDLETTLMVAAFWAFATDLTNKEQAKRLFGFVGAGGVIGGWAGITSARLLLEHIGTSGLLVLSAGFLVAVGLATARIEYLVDKTGVFQKEKSEPTLEGVKTSPLITALEGGKLVLRSRYLAAIVGLLTCYELASQVIEYQFSRLSEDIAGLAATQWFFVNIYFLANCLAVVVQLFLVSLLMRRFGIVTALLVLPLAQLGFSSAFLVIPTLFFASMLVISDNGLNYSIQQTSRETLYVVTSPEEKYKARAFTNMFVQRLAKGVGIFMIIGLGLVGLEVRYLSVITIVMMGLMVALSLYAGRRFDQKNPRKP